MSEHPLEIIEIMDKNFPMTAVVQGLYERRVEYAPHKVRVVRLIAWCTDTDDALAYIAERDALRGPS